MTVYGAIASIIEALGKQGIQKGKRNKEQGYAFRGIDDVLNALNPMLVEHKLIIIPSYNNRIVDPRPTKSGGVMYNVSVVGEFCFVSTVDGSSTTIGPFVGEAQDSADKATNKAMSAAYKAMAFQTFCIPTEGMEDADENTPEETVRRAPEPEPERTLDPGEIMQARAVSLVTMINNATNASEVDAVMTKAVKTLTHLSQHYVGLYRRVQEARQKRLAELKNNEPPFPDDDPYNQDIPA